jgi:uncharacterized Zn finger protein (UPF0148 family)
MANKLIPEELQALIQQYLTDGVLTDKERTVILKKAEGMGLDRDEIDLYLDAQIQKIDQASDTAMRRMKSKACPYCGAPIPQLSDKCPACGQFITPQASEELQEVLEKLEEALVKLKTAKDVMENKAIVERYARKAKMYYGNNPKIQKLLEEVEIEMVEAEKKIKSLKRSETTKAILSNPWTYAGLFIIFTILLALFIYYKVTTVASDKEETIYGMFGTYAIIGCIVGIVAFINKVCLKKK